MSNRRRIFMHNLAIALQKFYLKKKNHIIFTNGANLNQLSLQMWEELGFRAIDASALSRILKGERLFTPKQLGVFCRLLQISQRDTEYLFSCLSQDYYEKHDIHIPHVFLSSSDFYDLLLTFTKRLSTLLYQGNCSLLLHEADLFETLYQAALQNNLDTHMMKQCIDLYGTALYLQGRAKGSISTSQTALRDTIPIADTLFRLSNQYHLSHLLGYGNILLSDAYYICGGYSDQKKNLFYFRHAIVYAAKALPLFSDTHHEKLFAIRTIVSCANYLHDTETIAYFLKNFDSLLSIQPQENYTNALHLAGTLTKGTALLGGTHIFRAKELAQKHFLNTLEGSGIYELSDIKTDIETLLLLRSHDTTFLSEKVKKGLSISHTDSFSRHRTYLEMVQHFI